VSHRQRGNIRPRRRVRPRGITCSHLHTVRDVTPSARGCEDCLRIGSAWVHLRLCLACGHVACCDQSPNRHATAHFHAEGHPLVQSFEPGEDWLWCCVDEVMMEPA
jgi:uncharacterized UBP type Zn finger protein